MTVAAVRTSALPHAVFLRRMAGESALPTISVEARLGQAALLALRLTDLLEDSAPVFADAFHYQHLATERFCRDLPHDRIETAHLTGVVRSTADAFRERDVRLVVPALLAYAHYLEDELRLEEALDVLGATERVGGARLGSSNAIAVRLRQGRVLRKLNEFDEADRCYTDASALAAEAGDRHSELISRLGRAHTSRSRGNLDEAERSLREILADSIALGDRHVQALAEQDFGVVLSSRGQPGDAIPHVWRAFELYDDEPARTRVLLDLGVMLLTIGDAEGAERALTEVIQRGGGREVIANALIELMNCASYRGDRVGFERWRERSEAMIEKMPRNVLADFYVKMGIGWARLAQFDRAEANLGTALDVAQAAGLHEVVFRVERLRAGLRDCREELETSPEAAAEAAVWPSGVRDVSASLARLTHEMR